MECATESATMGSAIDPTVRTTTMPKPLLWPVLRREDPARAAATAKASRARPQTTLVERREARAIQRPLMDTGRRREGRAGLARDTALFPSPGMAAIRPGTSPKARKVRARQDLFQETSPRVVARTPRETNGVRPDGRSNPDKEMAWLREMVANACSVT